MNKGHEELSICCAKLLFDIHKVRYMICSIQLLHVDGHNILVSMQPKTIIDLPSILDK